MKIDIAFKIQWKPIIPKGKWPTTFQILENIVTNVSIKGAERHFYFLGLFDLEILKANKVQLWILMFTLNWLEQKSFSCLRFNPGEKVWNIISYYTMSSQHHFFMSRKFAKCNKCIEKCVWDKNSITFYRKECGI